MDQVGKDHMEEASERLTEPCKYVHNDIVKPFRVVIIQYAESVHEMHELAKYPPTTSMKGGEYDQADWNVYKYFSVSMIFALPLRTDSVHPCRMNWRIKLRTFIPHLMKNGVIFCPPCKLKITRKKSAALIKRIMNLRQNWSIMTEKTL